MQFDILLPSQSENVSDYIKVKGAFHRLIPRTIIGIFHRIPLGSRRNLIPPEN